MSWLISRALMQDFENSRSSLGLVAGFSEVTCSAGAPSAPLNTTPTPQAYCSPDKMTECSRLSRFGMTFAPLTAGRGAELLMSFLEDSRAKTLAQQGKAQALTAKGLAYGGKWPESLVKYDLDAYSWKTHRCLWEEELPWSSVILPRWGMTLTGVVLQHPMLERPISGTDSGLWRTPTVGMLNADRAKNPEYTARKEAKGQTITLADQVKNQRMWPTPKSGQCGLSAKTTGRAVEKSTHLTTQVALAEGMIGADGKVNQQASGHLNPMWVEWLMGWPQGWTDLAPLEMGKFLEWQQQHSICSGKAR
jgi:hypothetical protein